MPSIYRCIFNMNKKEKAILKLYEELNAIDNDVDRWVWVVENSDKVIVKLDNDETFVIFIGDYENKYYVCFDASIGRDYGIESLFEAIGITGESV